MLRPMATPRIGAAKVSSSPPQDPGPEAGAPSGRVATASRDSSCQWRYDAQRHFAHVISVYDPTSEIRLRTISTSGSNTKDIACSGQTRTHCPHPTHRSRSMIDFSGPR